MLCINISLVFVNVSITVPERREPFSFCGVVSPSCGLIEGWALLEREWMTTFLTIPIIYVKNTFVDAFATESRN